MKMNINTLLNVILILVVVGLLIFNKSVNPNVKLQEEKEQLEEENKKLEEYISIQKDSIIYYRDRDRNWIIQDSVKNVEIEKQKEITSKYKKMKQNAESSRKIAQKQLREFRKNPPVNNDPVNLILDTKKLIDEK